MKESLHPAPGMGLKGFPWDFYWLSVPWLPEGTHCGFLSVSARGVLWVISLEFEPDMAKIKCLL